MSSVKLGTSRPLPAMSAYTETHVVNTTFSQRIARSSTQAASLGHRRSRSVSPIGVSVAQRHAQLAASMAESATFGVERVAPSVADTRNVAEAALRTATVM